MRRDLERPYRVMGDDLRYVYVGYDIDRAILAFQISTHVRGASFSLAKNDNRETIIHCLDRRGEVVASLYGVPLNEFRSRLPSVH